MIVGVLGLYVEFTHPGMVAPGVVGGISLVLALYAMHILPVEPAGVVLILLALGLFILEAKYTSHGVLAVGGIVAMLLGALMLVRSPMTHAGVSLGVAFGVTLPFALIVVFLMRLVLNSRAWKPAMGREQFVGSVAEVTGPLVKPADGELFVGMVRLNGALWRAVAPQAIPGGSHVRVVSFEGLTLHVVPADATPKCRVNKKSWRETRTRGLPECVRARQLAMFMVRPPERGRTINQYRVLTRILAVR